MQMKKSIKRKLFRSNTMIVLIALLLFISITALLFLGFNKDILRALRSSSELSPYTSQVETLLKDPAKYGTDWQQMGKALGKYGFDINVAGGGEWKLYNNTSDMEWYGIEDLMKLNNTESSPRIFCLQGVTIVTTSYTHGLSWQADISADRDGSRAVDAGGTGQLLCAYTDFHDCHRRSA